MRHIIVISKKWNHPRISMVVTDEELSFAVAIDDFMTALKMEAGVDEGMGKKLDSAVESVVRGIKGESARIMG